MMCFSGPKDHEVNKMKSLDVTSISCLWQGKDMFCVFETRYTSSI